MKWKDMISMALGNLFKRKVRTVLTVAGVVIGTCAIVVMLSFGFGIRESMEAMMRDMGDLTVIQIHADSGSSKSTPLDDKALEKFKMMEHVVALTPVCMLDPSQVTVKSGKYRYDSMIYGVDMGALEAFGYKPTQGTLPKKEEENRTTILMGKDGAYDFIDTRKTNNNMVYAEPDKNGKLPEPFLDPMKAKLQAEPTPPENSTAKVKPVKLNCIGILEEDYGKSPTPSHCIFMDISLAKELQAKYEKLNNVKKDKNAPEGYSEASVKVDAVEHVSEVEEVIKKSGYSTYSMNSIRKPIEEQMRTIQMILGGLGAISLLVAALGIANTMTMSIYERTREIGIMKVLGCVVGNIRSMFLMEAGAIGFLGGIAGVGISYLISTVINTLAAQQKGGDAMVGLVSAGSQISIIPPWLALSALAFATLVGLVSGFGPANRAVKISALTAIKQE